MTTHGRGGKISSDHGRSPSPDPAEPPTLHAVTADTRALAWAVVQYALDRMGNRPTLGTADGRVDLEANAETTITADGLGVEEAMAVFRQAVCGNAVATDHPNYLAYVPCAPAPTAALFDLALSASGLIGSGWVDGAGSIRAENQALRYLADLIGLDHNAGGCFVSGGSAGNLSALAVARHRAEVLYPDACNGFSVVVSSETHASVVVAARLLNMTLVSVPTDAFGRLQAAAVQTALENRDNRSKPVAAVVATAGATATGLVDDLDGLAEISHAIGAWYHVDAAYGGFALTLPELSPLFSGLSHADSTIIDPHKGFFAPYDCCALIYARPEKAVGAFTQTASYLESGRSCDQLDPMDLAFHLTRRPRGLPFWFSLTTHGTDQYTTAARKVLRLTHRVAGDIRQRGSLELVMEPELSVILVRRRGWMTADYAAWCTEQCARETAFVQPDVWRDETVLRLCFLNPRTRFTDVVRLIDTLERSEL